MTAHSALTGAELHPPLGISTVGPLAVPATTAGAMLWTNAGNEILRVNTNTPAVIWGNTTDNPAYSWLGTGLASFSGHLAASTHRTVDSSGSNVAGANVTLRAGLATGTAATGDVVFQGADAIGSGSTLQAATERARIVGASGDLQLNERTNGQVFTLGSLTATVTLSSGAHQDSSFNLPANSIVLAVTARVTTTITGPTNWKYGKATDSPPNRYGATLALAAGTTSVGLDANGGVVQNASAVAVRIQAQDDVTAFTAGVVRLTAHYLTFTPPTS